MYLSLCFCCLCLVPSRRQHRHQASSTSKWIAGAARTRVLSRFCSILSYSSVPQGQPGFRPSPFSRGFTIKYKHCRL